VAVVGGLAVSQLITLFVTPVVYVWFDELKLRFARRRNPAPKQGVDMVTEPG
jgi:hypothetical protein